MSCQAPGLQMSWAEQPPVWRASQRVPAAAIRATSRIKLSCLLLQWWKMVWLPRKSGAGFSGGWRGFSLDHVSLLAWLLVWLDQQHLLF